MKWEFVLLGRRDRPGRDQPPQRPRGELPHCSGPRLSQPGAQGAVNRVARETGREGRSGQRDG